ncbi:MAG: diguanylate cyclase [Proteobacteria bacterium]|nr:diguanylate cyclase [Pseudomonadota bacterium]
MKVAIIEDSSTLVSVWKQMLEGADDYQVDFFDSKDDRFNALVQFEPSLIIFPGVPYHRSAANLTASVKSSSKLRDAALVVATSLTADKLKDNLNADIIDGVLVKPFTMSTLHTLLERFYHKKTLNKREIPLAVVVDDAPAVRSVMEKEMMALGFGVEVASNGQEGLELVREVLPDIVITDIKMPIKSGIELCADLAADPRTSSVPIIVISAGVTDQLVRNSFDSGAINFLPKPVDVSQLAETVSTVMGKHRVSRQGRILVLEDSPTISSVISRLLGELGITCIVCQSIAEMHAYLSISVPDVISLDLTLPDGNGLELCRNLRLNRGLDLIPIVIISGAVERETMVECLRSGANDFIEKPFTRDEFHARINNLLKVKRLQDELTQKIRILDNLAYHDSLTGLYNRRYLDDGIIKELERTKRSNESLGFFIIDLDNFKKVNDTYGHEVGDEILKEVASLMKQSVRQYDIPCRYGGEELCSILPGSSLVSTATVAERVRAACSERQFTEHAIKQTVSIGVSAFPNPSSEQELITNADRALYQAKKAGRNRVVVCSEEF